MNNSSSSPTVAHQCFFGGDQRAELTEVLTSRLIECGWRDQVSAMCRNLIQQHGVENIRLEQIVGEVGERARQMVPDQVRTELLELIRKNNQTQVEPMQKSQPCSQNQQEQESNVGDLLNTPARTTLPTMKEEDANSMLNDSNDF